MDMHVVCHTITPAMAVEGKRLYVVVFGVKMDQMKHQTQQGIPVLWDNRMQVFIDEAEWEKLSPKFTVGESYKLKIDNNTISLKK